MGIKCVETQNTKLSGHPGGGRDEKNMLEIFQKLGSW
jgi:hypothetical protein